MRCPLDEDTAWQFADLIDRAGTVPVTLIAPASTAATHFPEAEILNASTSEPQTLDHAGTDITVQRLQHAAYLHITTALKVSGQPPHPADGPWQDVPDEPDSMPQTQQASPDQPNAPATPAPIPSPTAATEVNGEVFPALLTASTDPSGLRPSPPPHRRPDTRTRPAPAPTQRCLRSRRPRLPPIPPPQQGPQKLTTQHPPPTNPQCRSRKSARRTTCTPPRSGSWGRLR